MTKVFDIEEADDATVLGSLMLNAMKHNWREFRRAHRFFDEADRAMTNLFGEAWHKNKEQIWQQIDEEDGIYES